MELVTVLRSDGQKDAIVGGFCNTKDYFISNLKARIKLMDEQNFKNEIDSQVYTVVHLS